MAGAAQPAGVPVAGATQPAGPPVAGAGPSAGTIGLSRFSLQAPAAGVPHGWTEQRLRGVPPNRFALVRDGSGVVAQIDSASSASSLAHPVDGPGQRATRLRWRWKVSGFPATERFGDKPGDDFAARLYVLFDYPLARVPFGERMLLRVARAVYGDSVPAAALCYVLDPRAPAGTTIDSPYTARVKVVVVRADATPGRWHAEARDLVRDFAQAFGEEHGPGVAPVSAIVLAADTDQGGGQVRAWFGDVELVVGPAG
jgi:hypothetical protein